MSFTNTGDFKLYNLINLKKMNLINLKSLLDNHAPLKDIVSTRNNIVNLNNQLETLRVSLGIDKPIIVSAEIPEMDQYPDSEFSVYKPIKKITNNTETSWNKFKKQPVFQEKNNYGGNLQTLFPTGEFSIPTPTQEKKNLSHTINSVYSEKINQTTSHTQDTQNTQDIQDTQDTEGYSEYSSYHI
jgi:hypothetical protein